MRISFFMVLILALLLVAGVFTANASDTLNYTVTPLVDDAGGTVTPAAPQTVKSGSTVSFNITPDKGFEASVWGTCGGSIDKAGQYVTGRITDDCVVEVSFIPISVEGN